MSLLQPSQNLVRFPSTRLLDANYGEILATSDVSLNEEYTINSGFSFPLHHPLVVPPPSGQVVDSKSNLLEREEVVRSKLMQQIASLERSIACQRQQLLGAEPVVKTLLAAAKRDPASTAHALLSRKGVGTNLAADIRRQRTGLLCANGVQCRKVTLPYSKFCLDHQANDSNQLLYPSCTRIDPNSLMKCHGTILDIFSENSLCDKHWSEAAVPSKRKAATHPQAPQKKMKLGMAKVMRERKNASLQSKVGPQFKVLKTVPAKVKTQASPWSSGDSDDGVSSSIAASLPVPTAMVEASKVVASSKSLDDLLTLVTAPLPKLDLLPLKADIGEIMMAGEDSSNDEQVV